MLNHKYQHQNRVHSIGSRQLGWKPQYDFEIGIKETIQWYISNMNWVNNIISGEYLRFMKSYYANK
jgi:dTDP-glucose 4,6-dehydratase